jgi:hypothetical protein
MKIILMGLAMLLGGVAAADEFAKIDKNGKVTWVIIANQKHIDSRNDGPWARALLPVGIGWSYDGVKFSSPTIALSTYTVVSSSATKLDE